MQQVKKHRKQKETWACFTWRDKNPSFRANNSNPSRKIDSHCWTKCRKMKEVGPKPAAEKLLLSKVNHCEIQWEAQMSSVHPIPAGEWSCGLCRFNHCQCYRASAPASAAPCAPSPGLGRGTWSDWTGTAPTGNVLPLFLCPLCCLFLFWDLFLF